MYYNSTLRRATRTGLSSTLRYKTPLANREWWTVDVWPGTSYLVAFIVFALALWRLFPSYSFISKIKRYGTSTLLPVQDADGETRMKEYRNIVQYSTSKRVCAQRLRVQRVPYAYPNKSLSVPYFHAVLFFLFANEERPIKCPEYLLTVPTSDWMIHGNTFR